MEAQRTWKIINGLAERNNIEVDTVLTDELAESEQRTQAAVSVLDRLEERLRQEQSVSGDASNIVLSFK